MPSTWGDPSADPMGDVKRMMEGVGASLAEPFAKVADSLSKAFVSPKVFAPDPGRYPRLTHIADEHPAKFSKPIIEVIEYQIGIHVDRNGLIWDPFGGVGTIHAIADEMHNRSVATEIEPEWAGQHPRTICADALRAPFAPGTFDAVVTSPCYGNRMADHHEAKDACGKCKGAGITVAMKVNKHGHSYEEQVACSTCKGSGLSRRNTYRHRLGRPLTPGSAAGMQWGDEYRVFHEEAWGEVWLMLKPGGIFMVNVSDHIRKGETVPVVQWHQDTILTMPFRAVDDIPIKTKRQKQGSNGFARVEHEHLLIFEKN